MVHRFYFLLNYGSIFTTSFGPQYAIKYLFERESVNVGVTGSNNISLELPSDKKNSSIKIAVNRDNVLSEATVVRWQSLPTMQT